MSTGEFKDVENRSLLEGEDSVSKGGTQSWSCIRAEFVWSLPQALTEKIGGWLNQTRNGVLQFWSRCVAALGLTAQLLRRAYVGRLHPFLVRLFIICFSIIQSLATFAWWFSCFLTLMTAGLSAVLLILESTVLTSEFSQQDRLTIKVFLVQAVIASVTIPTALYQYRTNRREEHSNFLEFIMNGGHGSKFFQIINIWTFCFLLSLGLAAYACLVMVVMMVVKMVLWGFVILIYLLLHYGFIFIVSVVKYIVVHVSRNPLSEVNHTMRIKKERSIDRTSQHKGTSQKKGGTGTWKGELTITTTRECLHAHILQLSDSKVTGTRTSQVH
ncbi:hypothetical protein R1sor_021491 [Riccia sorocarpa]|uniref:Uncharacterized protein n=1 Tax=Riccia sorocarpa TaxID=122646 RepID=A0ABD3GKJ5_9MARC